MSSKIALLGISGVALSGILRLIGMRTVADVVSALVLVAVIIAAVSLYYSSNKAKKKEYYRTLA